MRKQFVFAAVLASFVAMGAAPADIDLTPTTKLYKLMVANGGTAPLISVTFVIDEMKHVEFRLKDALAPQRMTSYDLPVPLPRCDLEVRFTFKNSVSELHHADLCTEGTVLIAQ